MILKAIRIRMPGSRPKRARRSENAFTKTYMHLEQAPVTFGPNGTFPDFFFLSPGSWVASDMLDANDQIKLVNKLTEKLQGSDFNASVFLGEGHQTLKMLADTAIRLAKAGHHARRFDILGAARSLFEGTNRRPLKKHDWRNPTWANNHTTYAAKNLSSLWLELQYGWMPLLNDAEACAQSLAHYLEVPFATTYRVSVRRETNTDLSANFGAYGTVTLHKTKSHRRSIIARISEKPTGWATLGLLDPELVAWELTPFSFVADWFIPIGSYLEARAKASRLVGTFITIDKRLGSAGPVKFNGEQRTPSRYRSMLFDRSISSSLSVPLPTVKPLEKAASVQHCRNAVALVIQVFGGGKIRS